MITDLSHITLVCRDIKRSGKFLQEIFGAVEQYTTSKEKFFKIGVLWLVILEGDSVAKTYNHLAFEADHAEFSELRKKLHNLELGVLEGSERTAVEGDSIYFYDYDNHLFELHSGDLGERLKRYKDSEKI